METDHDKDKVINGLRQELAEKDRVIKILEELDNKRREWKPGRIDGSWKMSRIEGFAPDTKIVVRPMTLSEWFAYVCFGEEGLNRILNTVILVGLVAFLIFRPAAFLQFGLAMIVLGIVALGMILTGQKSWYGKIIGYITAAFLLWIWFSGR